jgi:hypothetical protein
MCLVLLALLLPLPTLAVVDTMMKSPPFYDCNHNGIADYRDRLRGTWQDLNKNGVEDLCDPDTSVTSLALTGWQNLSPDSSIYFDVIYDPSHNQIHIHYVVPTSRHHTLLSATPHGSSAPTMLESKRIETPANGFDWRLIGSDGKPAASGHWELTLRVDDVEYRKQVSWDWSKVSKL